MSLISVVIVDDDEWIRRGRTEGLSQFHDVRVVAALQPDEALQFDWAAIDVVLVDAHDERRTWDRFPGVAVVEAIRRQRDGAPTVIVISGHTIDPMLRLRMAEAGADFFYAHLELPTPEALVQAIRRPDRRRRVDQGDEAELARLGLRRWSKPNSALAWAQAAGLQDLFTADGSQKSSGASRRSLNRARDEIGRRAHLDPSLGDPLRRPGDVTWRDVARFVNRALGRPPR